MKVVNTNSNLVEMVADILDVHLTVISHPAPAEKPPLGLRVLQGDAQKTRILLAHLKNSATKPCISNI